MSNIPTLRFPEFIDEWTTQRMSEFLIRYSENNRDQEFNIDDILSLSTLHGIVNRKELLEDTYNNVNHLNYKKTRLNDLVYGKSISANFPFGLFKVNDYKDGLLSTLYFTFKVKEGVLPNFLDVYFSYPNRANKFLRKYVLVGDRYITADADYLLSGQITIPSLSEQQKIVSFLSSIDDWIENLMQQKLALENYKKGIMQKIFSQEIRFKDENGNYYPDWEEKNLGQVFDRITRRNSESNTNVLTISAQQGLINQEDFFNKSVAAKDISNYYLLNKDEFAYNKSYSKGYPMGAIKRLRFYEKGVVSPLYICFKAKINNSPEFFEHYFNSGIQNREIEKIAQEGARNHGLLNISVVDFFESIFIQAPSYQEQQKIGLFLSSIDDLLHSKDTQLIQAKQWKKGLMQKLFI